jgi:hypothetical protein
MEPSASERKERMIKKVKTILSGINKKLAHAVQVNKFINLISLNVYA